MPEAKNRKYGLDAIQSWELGMKRGSRGFSVKLGGQEQGRTREDSDVIRRRLVRGVATPRSRPVVVTGMINTHTERKCNKINLLISLSFDGTTVLWAAMQQKHVTAWINIRRITNCDQKGIKETESVNKG
ncbi:hypothetical protein H920_00099 [Fukomys damarensis]|uniref:Uncharacterized protein n=1 Tax=Fukomys damarensis TaxID=885580 RepID=A0A091E760_FUKDA|nr:hypothetical protein H920_00099 [Fukomys damarensis]